MSRPGKMDHFEKAVLRHICRHSLLEPGMRVVVAVSGGADSTALLLALQRLIHRLQTTVTAAHVNHRFRGRASDEDEAFVKELCRQQRVPLQISRPSLESSGGLRNLENRARVMRYDFLCRLAAEQGARVATGHTLNDQAETFLMKLVRGAGPRGLSGIYPRRANPLERLGESGPILVIRPLLECTREEVIGYLAQKEQDFRCDETNQNTTFDRNWVREQLIPQLENRLNPKLIRTLGRTAALFREVDEVLEREARQARVECGNRSGNVFRLSLPELKRLSPIVRKVVIRQTLHQLRGTLSGIHQRHIEDILALTDKISGKEIHLPGHWKVEREFERLVFRSNQQSKPFSYPLPVPGETWLHEVGKRVITRRAVNGENHSQGVYLLFPTSPLTVRSRLPGDRYQLASGSPPRKLKKILRERRLSRFERDRLLVLAVDGQVVWVEGFLPHPAFRPKKGMRDLLQVDVR